MSSHLLLLISLMVSLHSSFPRPDTLTSRYYAYHSNNPKASSVSSRKALPTQYKQSVLSTLSSGSGDIIEATRTQAESLKTTLRSLTSQPEAAPILEKVFSGKEGGCMNNMDEVMETIETSTALFENAGSEIKQLVQSVQAFQDLTDTPKSVRETAKIIRILDVLIPKLTPSDSVCSTSGVDVLESMRGLSALVDELSLNDDLYFSPQKRQSLKSSALIVSQVTDFLDKESHFKFDHFCTKVKKYNTEFITAVGKMMADLADLYTGLGGFTAAEELRKQEDFTRNIVAKINKLGYLDIVSIDCNTLDSSKLVANTLDDLAGIIEDVGMENLCKQLELDSSDCSF